MTHLELSAIAYVSHFGDVRQPSSPISHCPIQKLLFEGSMLFLRDRRIVDIPPLLWKPILHGIVLRSRPPKTVKKYQAIWTKSGSPYTLAAQSLEQLLGRELNLRLSRPQWPQDGAEAAEAGADGAAAQARKPVPALAAEAAAAARIGRRFAHRYGKPSIADALRDFQQQGVQRLVVLPLYPQRAYPTTDSVYDELQLQLSRLCYQPETSFIWDYHDNPLWVAAVADSIKAAIGDKQTHLLFSFHSEPLKELRRGDPYRRQVESSVAAICAKLKLSSEQYSIAYQSRFEDTQRWLGPFLPSKLEELQQRGLKDIQIVCQGFSLDCIETLYDIDLELRQQSKLPFRYIPCLNNSPSHVAAIAGLIEAQLSKLI